MTPKEYKDRLFKHGRPLVRPLDFTRDFWVLWAAYDLGGFPLFPRELNQEQFGALLTQALLRPSAVLIVEDQCKWFREKTGPIGLVLIDNFDWRIEPFPVFFKWTTPRMKLRAAAAFLQMIRHDSSVGVCVVRSPKETLPFCEHLEEKYHLLEQCGRIPRGNPKGTEYLFFVHGKRRVPEPQAQVTEGVVEIATGGDG